MKTTVRIVLAAILLLAAPVWNGATAQCDQSPWNQSCACPGWNNPTNFITGSSNFSYKGYFGEKQDHTPYNVMTGVTGVSWNTNTIYTANQLATAGLSGCTSKGTAPIPDHDKSFAIMTTSSVVSGHPVNRDPNTADHLRFVPDHFNTSDTTPGAVNTTITRSIRIGDDCATSPSYDGAALDYDMYVTTENALMFIYYAVVVEAPTHGVDCNPTFIIRVMKQNASGAWAQISDTLAYYISSTPAQGQGLTVGTSYGGYGTLTLAPNYNTNGWHSNNLSNGAQCNSSSVLFKDWVKVALNLSNLLYEHVRIEIMIADCCMSYHYGYAYVAGECREMTINTEGCPPGRSTNVATLTAPRGMNLYQWSASNMGKSDPVTRLNPGGDDDWFTFRDVTTPLTEAQGGYIYNAQANDFKVRYDPRAVRQFVAIDSTGKRQTFRCRMTSALDPAKPFTSDLYVSVDNTKPTMEIDSMSFCDGNVRLWNRSYVPGDPTLVVDSNTSWTLYNNPGCLGTPITTLRGDSVDYNFGDTSVHGLIVRTVTTDAECYSEALYTVKPRINPIPGMSISQRVLCDADETTVTDTTSNSYYREWYIVNEASPTTDSTALVDTLRGYGNNNISFTQPFTHSIEPIGLMVRNGLWYLNPYNTADTIWCSAITYDTVAVFVHPELEVTGDTIVCQGSQTDAMVRAVGVDGCTYEWSRTYGSITGGIPSGARLQVTPYADTSVYYVRVTSPEGCVAWDSIHAYLVRPQLAMYPDDGVICPGDTVILTGSAADHYSWSASPADPSLNGQQGEAVVHVTPAATTTYTMIGHGTNDCDASPLTKTVTVRPLPVPRITTSPSFVDPDDPTVVIRDISPNGVTSQWTFDDGSTQTGREVTHTFKNAVGNDSVYVDLTAANVLNCEASRRFGIPVILYTAWFPTIFTPGSEDENAKFRLYSVNSYEHFHIYIYDRHGMLMFESDSPDFEWDGTHNGQPCPQGAYVYTCNYRKPLANTLSTKSGSVTLIR